MRPPHKTLCHANPVYLCVKALMGELHCLAGQLEDLRAGCPMQGCGAGKDGELSALWRRWASLCRGVGLLLAHSEQRGAEWTDVTTSVWLYLYSRFGF